MHLFLYMYRVRKKYSHAIIFCVLFFLITGALTLFFLWGLIIIFFDHLETLSEKSTCSLNFVTRGSVSVYHNLLGLKKALYPTLKSVKVLRLLTLAYVTLEGHVIL